MGNAGDNPFRSGHTAALDLDQLEKDEDEGWPTKPKKSEWASNDWSGGADAFPDEFMGGGSSGTAALDISEFDGLDEGDAPWVREERRRKAQQGFGGPRPTSDFGDFGADKGHTLSLDVEDFAGPAPEPFDQGSRRRAERSEDVRNLHTHNDQRGKRSYRAGQGDPNLPEDRVTRGKGRSFEPDSAFDEVEELPDMDRDEGQDLMPHERTMAISMEDLSKGPPEARARPHTEHQNQRTDALEVGETRRGTPAPPANHGELAPHERTMAFDLHAMEDEEIIEELPTDQLGLPAPGPSSSMRRITNQPSVILENENVRTSVIDQKDIENFRLNEASSGGKLLIFVPGAEPVLFDLRPGVTNIGRERTNHLVLSDPFCSRKHLRLKKQGDKFIVRDNGSDNGTLLNEAILPGQLDRELDHGDDIAVGSTVMRFILGSPRPEDYTPPVIPTPGQPPLKAPPLSPPDDALPYEPDYLPAQPSGGGRSSLLPIIVLIVFALGTIALIILLLAVLFWPSG